MSKLELKVERDSSTVAIEDVGRGEEGDGRLTAR
jgi:hypothetical protein